MSWTDERVELLKKCWAAGESASQIQRRLNADRAYRALTRSAVIGKVHRLGLSRRDAGAAARKTSQANGKASPWRQAATKSKKFSTRPPRLPVAGFAAASNPLHDVARKQLADLADDECRWPVGDPLKAGFGFCARRREPGFAYCAHHAMRAHESPKVKTPPAVAPAAASSKPATHKKEFEPTA